MAGFFDQIVGYLTTDEVIDRFVADGRPVDHDAVRIGAVLAAVAVVFDLAPRVPAEGGDGWLTGLGSDGPEQSPPSLMAPAAEARRRGAAQARGLWGRRTTGVAALVGQEAHLDDDVAADLLAVTTWVTVAHLIGPATAPPGGPAALQAEADRLRAEGWDRWRDTLAGATVEEEPEFQGRRARVVAGILALIVVIGAVFLAVQLAGGDGGAAVDGGDDVEPEGPSAAEDEVNTSPSSVVSLSTTAPSSSTLALVGTDGGL
ncbi:MAG: hypothetical protein ACFCVK_02630 [Acidimicrobiales bacterium]